MRIVIIAHYFPPVNSSGAKRAEALSKYFTEAGHHVTVLTTTKTSADGEFTEVVPPGVNVVELSWAGRERPSRETAEAFEPMYIGKPSLKRRIKDTVMRALGQIPDTRLPFSLSMLAPWFSQSAKNELRSADIVIGTTPPWPMVFAALICKWRFGKPCILDYRDHFSECHEMPGGPFAKRIEKIIDRRLAGAADHLVCISDPMSEYYSTMAKQVTTIRNGYDGELIDKARALAQPESDGHVTIRYMGIVSPGRVPYHVLEALVELERTAPAQFAKLRFQYFGNTALIDEALRKQYPSIRSAFFFFSAVPYLESLTKITEADYLLFSETSLKNSISAQGILTTKLFEYVGSGRPIIADISPDTLAGSLLVRCSSRNVVGNVTGTFTRMFNVPSFYERKPDEYSPLSESLSRKSQAGEYLTVITKTLAKGRA